MLIFEAGPVTVLRTILIIVLVYYGVKLLIKYLFPIILKRFIAKQQSKFNQNKSASSDDGEPISESSKKPKEPGKDGLGEYVEYEEVD
jgi:hypothetical protein